MNKKNYAWLVVALVVVALAVYLLVSWPETVETPEDLGANTPAIGNETGDGTAVDSSDGSSLPEGIEPVINPATDPTYSQETIIKVTEDGFSPKTIEAKAGTKAFLTFSADDEERHTFAFTDPNLDFILVVFNKAEGDKSITFPAPQAGSYTFYIDDQENQGTLLVK